MLDFKPIPGYEGIYRINKQGQILGPYNKILRTSLSGPYPSVYLYKNGKRTHVNVHKLVLLTWAGPRPKGSVIRHIDGNPLNCILDNLSYGTSQENETDKKTHGTFLFGEKCHNAVLTERKVKIARGLHKCKFTIKRIAEILQVKYQTAWSCIHRGWASAG